jgi:hypothetical protein
MDTARIVRFALREKQEGKADMAKKKRLSATKQVGPYLATAVLCEKVIKEEDGVFSIVRIIDRITFQLPAGLLSSGVFSLGAALYQACLFVTFKTGYAKGKRALSLKAFSPDGSKLMEDLTLSIQFDGKGETGAAANIQIGVQFRMEGLHWFHLFLDGQQITRIPLQVITQQQATSGSSVFAPKKQ